MIRKSLLPALLVGLLGGCVSAGYGYRDGYYYGQPSVEYRYYDYGYPYSHGYFPYAGRYGHYNYHGYPYSYGYYPYAWRYGYNNYYYAHPYRYGYGYPYYRYGHSYHPHHRHRHPKPSVDGTPGSRPPHTDDGDDNPPSWRDPNRRRRMDDVAGRALQNQGTIQSPPREAPHREVRSEGSRMGQAMKRTQETRRRESGNVQEP